ncbi:MAG: peptide MFS transporter [Acidobacteria bacterium]|nr:peptide MFS transporter [Acidobacteriota bacterium]MDA1234663.1 peptide MFS transporter [Acidobacteriota bacterium]
MNESETSAGGVQRDTGGIGGHPRGLTTLFFTEMWERLSYYGMRSFLVLFLTASAATGGLGLTTAVATRVYGLYTASVYLACLPGGWVADRLIGLRKAVLWGGIAIMAGHFTLVNQSETAVYIGLILIVIGTGLLKPNISALVGELYERNDPRKDSGFSLYYMGINLGAFLAPLICGTLAQKVGWHWGFGAAGVGMLFGLIQYTLTANRLGQAGKAPAPGQKTEFSFSGVLWFLGVGLILIAMAGDLVFGLELSQLQRFVILLAGSTVFMVALYVGGNFDATEKKRGISIFVLFLVAALFWAGFEQAGSSLTLFADRMTDNALLGMPFPSTWFQSLNPVFIVLLAPVFSWLWIRMGSKQPSSPMKFSLGLVGVGLGFIVMMFAARLVTGDDSLVSPGWLFATYLLHTLGELCLSPVGLSVMTKLAPQKIVGQIMGVWFLAASIGNYIGGEIAGLFESLPLPQLFGTVAAINIGVAVLVIALAPLVKKQMGGVR